MTTEDRALMQVLADRVRKLEQRLANPQPCPADPCHIHYVATVKPKHDITTEDWANQGIDAVSVVRPNGPIDCMVCYSPYTHANGYPLWPQRRVLIVHAPRMYRELELTWRYLVVLNSTGIHGVRMSALADLLTQIQEELQENER